MVENIFGIVFILMAAKNYTRNFSDTPFDPDYYTSSEASLTTPYNKLNFVMCYQKNLFEQIINNKMSKS